MIRIRNESSIGPIIAVHQNLYLILDENLKSVSNFKCLILYYKILT